MNKVTVTIQGANYIIVGEKTDKEILTIANYVNSEMDKLKESAPNLGSLQVSILTSLNLADLLFECSHENESLLKQIDELKEKLGQPNEEIQVRKAELENSLKTKAIEIAKSNREIERLNAIISEQASKIDSLSNVTEGNKSQMEDYKAQVQSLQAQLSEMQERAITAEDLSSQWQNKSFNLQLAITDLENQLKTANNTDGIVPAE